MGKQKNAYEVLIREKSVTSLGMSGHYKKR
jgi:hypothetical protein